MRMADSTQVASRAGDRYLLLADISGYTAFMASVESAHGVDFSAGIPAGFGILGKLLDGVVEGVQPDFEVIKLEGDAVFAVAPAASLDGRGGDVLDRLQALYETFRTRREVARAARDHVCTACPVVSNLDLKMVLHRGQAIRQTVGSQTELLGPAVNVAHRLLKNSIQAHLGYRPYVFLTDAAAAWLHLAELGVEHREDYPDVGPVSGRVVPLGESPGQSILARTDPEAQNS
jgi:class 3 adenylate cyclase